MPESTAFARRTHLGGATLARIPGGLASGVTGTVACDDLSSWVGGVANGPTRTVVNRGLSDQEEIEITGISGNNITIPTGGRGLGGTSDTTHSANATIEISHSPRDFDEANRLVNAILGISGLSAGDLLYLLSSTTFARLAKGTARQALLMNAGATAPEWAASLQSLLTAQGDLIFASAANTPARLAKGTAFQELRMNAAATAPEWGGFSGARAYNSAPISVNNNTPTILTMDSELFDTDTYHSTASNTSRLTAPRAGYYLAMGQITWAANATGLRLAAIFVNGLTVASAPVQSEVPGYAADSLFQQVQGVVLLTAGQYVELDCQQTSGGALNATPALSLHWIGP